MSLRSAVSCPKGRRGGNIEHAAGVTQAAAILRGTHLVARHISPAATSSMCGSRAGCVVVAKPHDRYQPRRILRDHLNDPSAIANVLRYATLPVMGRLDPERYAALTQSGGAKADDLAPDQYHVILFLPAASSEFPSGGRSRGTPLWTPWARWRPSRGPRPHLFLALYGHLAVLRPRRAQPRPGRREPPRQDGHRVPSRRPGPFVSPAVAAGVTLADNAWEPSLAGIDYLRLLEEDAVREAEDNLILEMEADLSTRASADDELLDPLFAHEELQLYPLSFSRRAPHPSSTLALTLSPLTLCLQEPSISVAKPRPIAFAETVYTYDIGTGVLQRPVGRSYALPAREFDDMTGIYCGFDIYSIVPVVC
ncbi:hypothetical protein C7M84_015561 [Penaeus vannamei]|uniref:Uncharacterized protein n=1 Tax=Penaeus vannamei TaxID=6689 RepID=A0A3R7LWK1_PENVA|nr:hypothetical protein C7M84_015561 [Penaeus vannamei]